MRKAFTNLSLNLLLFLSLYINFVIEKLFTDFFFLNKNGYMIEENASKLQFDGYLIAKVLLKGVQNFATQYSTNL